MIENLVVGTCFPGNVIADFKEYPEKFTVWIKRCCYTVNDNKNMSLYAAYRHRSHSLDNIYLPGRLENFCYGDMDDAILNALKLGERITNA